MSGKSRGTNACSSLVLFGSRRRRRLMMPFKMTPFASFSLSFFSSEMHEMTLFCENASFHLNRSWRQNVSDSKLAL